MASVPEGIKTAIPGHSSVPSGLISCDTWRWLTIDSFDNFYLQGRSQHKLNSISYFTESHLLLSYVHPRVRKQLHPVLWLEKESLKKDDKNNNKHFTNTSGWLLTYKKKTDDDSIERRKRRHATLERKRELEPRYDPQLFLGWLLRTRQFFLSLVTIPEVFAKVNFSQRRMGGWRCYPCNSCKERKQIKRINIWIWIIKFCTLYKLIESSLLSLSRAEF